MLLKLDGGEYTAYAAYYALRVNSGSTVFYRWDQQDHTHAQVIFLRPCRVLPSLANGISIQKLNDNNFVWMIAEMYYKKEYQLPFEWLDPVDPRTNSGCLPLVPQVIVDG